PASTGKAFPLSIRIIWRLGSGSGFTQPVVSMSKRSIDTVRPGTNLGEYTAPAVKSRESSGCKSGFGREVVGTSLTNTFLTGSKRFEEPVTGGAFSSTSVGILYPSPHVARTVSESSNGCQRMP